MPDPASTPNSGNTPAAGAPPAAGTPASNQAWYPDQHKDYVTNKGWKDPGEVLESYVNLEKLMGAEKAGRTVIMPKDDADLEGHKAFRAKLGVPESADKYELEVPQDADPAFSKTAAKWFHDAGIPKSQAQAIVKNWNGFMASEMQRMDAELTANSTRELDALKLEWGGDFDKKSAFAKDFLRQSGWTDEDVAEYEKARGTSRMLKDFATWGAKVQEAGFAGGPSQGGGGTVSITKDVAKAKLEEIRANRLTGAITDKDWHTGKKAEFEKYSEIVFGA